MSVCGCNGDKCGCSFSATDLKELADRFAEHGGTELEHAQYRIIGDQKKELSALTQRNTELEEALEKIENLEEEYLDSAPFIALAALTTNSRGES